MLVRHINELRRGGGRDIQTRGGSIILLKAELFGYQGMK